MFNVILREHFNEPTDYEKCFHLCDTLLHNYIKTFGQHEEFDVDIPNNDIDACYVAELIFDRFEWSDKL